MTEPTYEWRTRDQDYPDGWMPWTEVAPGTYGITCPDYADATDIHIRIKPGTEIALVAPNADRRTADTITDDDLDALYAERDTYRRLLHETVDLAELTHKYGSMGGHDRAGLNLGCAGCELHARIRAALPAADTDTARGET